MLDLHNNIRSIPTIPPQTAGTTGTGRTGAAVDISAYNSVELEFSYGAITATNATMTPIVQHSDTPTAADFASVADADLIGTEAAAGIAAGVRVDGSNKNVVKRVGYKGAKKYVRAKLVNTATAGAMVGVNVIGGHPKNAPAAA